MSQRLLVATIFAPVLAVACKHATLGQSQASSQEEPQVGQEGPLDMSFAKNHVMASPDYRTLADTGFSLDPAVRMERGIRFFSPQYPLWTDGLKKKRWVYLPPGEQIITDRSSDESGDGSMDFWIYPVGTKFWKEFAVQNPGGSIQPVETRFMEKLKDGTWAYATFAWQGSNNQRAENLKAVSTTAQLKGAVQRDVISHLIKEDVVTHDLPSQSNCVFCHTNGHDPVLGFTALQLSDDRDPNAPHQDPLTPEMTTLGTLIKESLLTKPPTMKPRIKTRYDDQLKYMVHRSRERENLEKLQALERTAIGYLSSTCGSCHLKGRGENGAVGPHGRAAQYSMDFRYRLEREYADQNQPLTKLIDDPRNDAVSQMYKIPGTEWPMPNYAIVTGHPELSQVIFRLSGRGQSQTHHGRTQSFNMPKVGSKLIDIEGIEAIEAWIKSLPENPAQLDRLKHGSTTYKYEDDPHSIF